MPTVVYDQETGIRGAGWDAGFVALGARVPMGGAVIFQPALRLAAVGRRAGVVNAEAAGLTGGRGIAALALVGVLTGRRRHRRRYPRHRSGKGPANLDNHVVQPGCCLRVRRVDPTLGLEQIVVAAATAAAEVVGGLAVVERDVVRGWWGVGVLERRGREEVGLHRVVVFVPGTGLRIYPGLEQRSLGGKNEKVRRGSQRG